MITDKLIIDKTDSTLDKIGIYNVQNLIKFVILKVVQDEVVNYYSVIVCGGFCRRG